jgi:hypothetical protein
MAAAIRSRSDVGGTEPEGDDVRGGVDGDGLTEIGVDGCSGALAVALRALGSSKRESCDVAGEGDFEIDGILGVKELLVFRTWSLSLEGSSMHCMTSLRDTLRRDLII